MICRLVVAAFLVVLSPGVMLSQLVLHIYSLCIDSPLYTE